MKRLRDFLMSLSREKQEAPSQFDQPLVKPRHKRIFYFYERSARHLLRRMKENW
jgi:hypothetical protein